MTPIRFNLLAEEQLAEQQSARDPVKVAIAIGIGLVALTASTRTIISFQTSQVQGKESVLQTQWNKLSAPEALQSGEELKKAASLADDFTTIGNSRFLYAPQLAVLKDIVPDTILLTRMTFTLNVSSRQEGPQDVEAGAKPRPRRVSIVQRVILQLDGRATSARPEIAVDDFIQTIKTNPVLTNMIETVQLRSTAPISTVGEAGSGVVPSVAFVIECQYKELK